MNGQPRYERARDQRDHQSVAKFRDRDHDHIGCGRAQLLQPVVDSDIPLHQRAPGHHIFQHARKYSGCQHSEQQ